MRPLLKCAISGLALLGTLLYAGTGQGQVPIPPAQFPAPVSINSEQIALLTKEAGTLETRITQAEGSLKGMGTEQPQKAAVFLSDRAQAEAATVVSTRAAFLNLSGNNPLQRRAADLFFGQFENQYRQLSGSTPKAANPTTLSTFRIRAFDVLVNNMRAYQAVATAKALTFDLDVASAPAGASVSYRRAGDPYQRNADPTNTTVRNLVYAIWSVRAELPNRQPQEKEHNPWREPNHVLVFVF